MRPFVGGFRPKEGRRRGELRDFRLFKEKIDLFVLFVMQGKCNVHVIIVILTNV